MPKATKKKNYIVIDPNLVWDTIHDLVNETHELCQKYLDRCIQDEHTIGAPTAKSITRNYYWIGAQDILSALCVRIGIADKKSARLNIKRSKELK